MTRRRRRMLGALVSVILALTVAWAAIASDGGGRRARIEAAGDGSPSTDTTLALVPVTSGAPLPTTTSTPPPVPMPTPEQVAAAVPPPDRASPQATPALDGTGALLARPAADVTRRIDKAAGCRSANDAGWRIVDCGALRRDDGVVVWVIQSKGKALEAIVLRERTAGEWLTVLSARDEAGSRWSSIAVRGEDVSGDGRPDLVFGFRGRDPARTLAVDVMDGPGSVGLHVSLPGGSARVQKGQLTGWARLADGSFDESGFRVIAGAWRLATSDRVAPSDVPPSMV